MYRFGRNASSSLDSVCRRQAGASLPGAYELGSTIPRSFRGRKARRNGRHVRASDAIDRRGLSGVTFTPVAAVLARTCSGSGSGVWRACSASLKPRRDAPPDGAHPPQPMARVGAPHFVSAYCECGARRSRRQHLRTAVFRLLRSTRRFSTGDFQMSATSIAEIRAREIIDLCGNDHRGRREARRRRAPRRAPALRPASTTLEYLTATRAIGGRASPHVANVTADRRGPPRCRRPRWRARRAANRARRHRNKSGSAPTRCWRIAAAATRRRRGGPRASRYPTRPSVMPVPMMNVLTAESAPFPLLRRVGDCSARPPTRRFDSHGSRGLHVGRRAEEARGQSTNVGDEGASPPICATTKSRSE
jgi:hypothetical protein